MPYRRKRKRRFLGALLAGVSLPFLFLFLSGLISAGADIAALFGLSVPVWLTGVASLLFIAGVVVSWLLDRSERGRG